VHRDVRYVPLATKLHCKQNTPYSITSSARARINCGTVSVQVTAPLGQYDPDRLINLGSNRWVVRPQIGASKVIGPVTLELAQTVNFFSNNNDFLGGHILEQAPVYATRANLIYKIDTNISVILHALYFTGGRTTLNGLQNDETSAFS
jgi:hypothetical protein